MAGAGRHVALRTPAPVSHGLIDVRSALIRAHASVDFAAEPRHNFWNRVDIHVSGVKVDDAGAKQVGTAHDGVGDERLSRSLDALQERFVESVQIRGCGGRFAL